jgi:hypothetical protein
MARYVIQNQITDIAKVKEFDLGGYGFNAEFSKGNDWVFTRKIAE